MRLTIHPDRQDTSIIVTLAHIAAVLEFTADSALPAGETLTLELTPEGRVLVTRQDGKRLLYQHPRARFRQDLQTAQPDAAQLPLFESKSA